MEKNSYISSFKGLPVSFLAALVVVLAVEVLLFSRSYLVADVSNACIVHKARWIRAAGREDIIVIGASRALSIDAAAIGKELGGSLSVVNFAVPHAGTSLEFYLLLKTYLAHRQNRPAAILLSVPPEMLGIDDLDGVFQGDPRGEMGRFRRLFTVWDLVRYTPFREKWSIVPRYRDSILPSYHYGRLAVDSYPLASPLTWRWERLREIVEWNRTILHRLDVTRGQLVYYSDEVVSAEKINEGIPVQSGGHIAVDKVEKSKNIERFISLAEKEGIPVIFFFMPLIEERCEKMQAMGFIAEVNNKLLGYEKRYGNFYFYRGLNLSYERESFGDWSHLNNRGAVRFNEELRGRIREMLHTAGVRIFQ